MTIAFNREPSVPTETTTQPDESGKVEPLSPNKQLEYTNMTTRLRNLEQHYPAHRATEYRAQIDLRCSLNRIAEKFRRNVNEYCFEGDERCVLGSR